MADHRRGQQQDQEFAAALGILSEQLGLPQRRQRFQECRGPYASWEREFPSLIATWDEQRRGEQR